MGVPRVEIAGEQREAVIVGHQPRHFLAGRQDDVGAATSQARIQRRDVYPAGDGIGEREPGDLCLAVGLYRQRHALVDGEMVVAHLLPGDVGVDGDALDLQSLGERAGTRDGKAGAVGNAADDLHLALPTARAPEAHPEKHEARQRRAHDLSIRHRRGYPGQLLGKASGLSTCCRAATTLVLVIRGGTGGRGAAERGWASRWLGWLAPRPSADEELARVAGVVHVVGIALAIGVLPAIAHNWAVGLWWSVVVLVAEEALTVACLALNRRGAVRVASRLLVLSAVALAASLQLTSEYGVHDVSVLIYPGAILVAGALLIGAGTSCSRCSS